MKAPSLWITRVEESQESWEKESQVSGIDQIFTKIIEGNVPKVKKHLHTYKEHTDKTKKKNMAYHS